MLSDSLLSRASYDDVHEYLVNMYKHSGDGMAFDAAWHVLGVGPTFPSTAVSVFSNVCLFQ